MTNIPQTWIDEGKASLLPSVVSNQFRDYLDTLPWLGSSLEWARMEPYTKIDLSRASLEELAVWTKSTALGDHSHVALCFSPKESCLLVRLEDGVRHLDELFWDSPGIRFCFGVDMVDGKPRPSFEALLQYGTGDYLFAKARSS